MRFYLDECLSPRVLDPVRAVFTAHEFKDYQSETLTGMKDVPLFAEVSRRGFDAFITVDRAQLANPAELAAIKSGTCHWIGFAHASGQGVSLIARIGATLLETVAYLVDNPPEKLCAYQPRLAGRERSQLFRRVQSLDDL